MRLLPRLLVGAMLTISPVAAPAQPSESAVELQALAEGYAAAFPRLYQANTLTLVMKRDGRTIVLKDVRKLEAVSGVLIVSVGSTNDKFVINPRDIVFLTDATRHPALD